MPQFDESRLAKTRMDEVLQKLDEAYKGIHTGRASTALLENIPVNVYGQLMPIKGIAQLSVPEATQVVITPWDQGNLVQIEAALREANLGVSAVTQGQAIRVSFPPMTAERREALIKELGKIAEEARVALRTVRHEAMEAMKRAIQAGEATEDDKFGLQKELDTLIKASNGRIEELTVKKEAEIRSV